jgi:hypothetical protein
VKSFLRNPQFLLTIPNETRTELVVDLTVSDEADSIGFLMVKQDSMIFVAA